MVSNVFTQFMNDLFAMGVWDGVLPFLLFFTILFATLQKTKVLGSTKGINKKGDEVQIPHKNYNVVVALAIALMVVMPHFTMNSINSMTDTTLNNGWPDPVVIVNNSLPQISVFAVAIIMVMLLVGILGPSIKIGGTPLTFWMAIVSFIVVAGIFGLSLFGEIPSFLSGWEEYMPIIVIILVFGVIIYFITKSPSAEPIGYRAGRYSGYLTGEEDARFKKGDKAALKAYLDSLKK